MPGGRPRKTPEGSRTTARGYGAEHQKARAAALAALLEGVDRCPFCQQAMFRRQALDYDHVLPISQGGKDGPRRLSHASCNRSAGGKLRHGKGAASRPSHFSASWDELRCSGCSCDLPRARCKAVA